MFCKCNQLFNYMRSLYVNKRLNGSGLEPFRQYSVNLHVAWFGVIFGLQEVR